MSQMMDEPNPIDRIFRRLAATYGAAWDRSMGQAPLMDVKTAWAHELAGFTKSRDDMMAIKWALENLPERCPNAIEFKRLCAQAPAQRMVELPPIPPKADPQRVAQAIDSLSNRPTHDPREWARRIIARQQAGEKLNPTSAQYAKQALGMVA